MLEGRIRQLFSDIRKEARKKGIDAEFTFHRERSGLIRLGNSSVALSTSEELTRADISVQKGRKVGSCSMLADITDLNQLRTLLDGAVENCNEALPQNFDPQFGEVEKEFDDSTGYDPALENLSALAKSELCAKVIRELSPMGDYDFSGSWSTGSTEMYYTTTANDRDAYRRLTDGRFVMVLKEKAKKWELQVELSQKAAGSFDEKTVISQFKDLLPVFEKNAPYRPTLGKQKVIFTGQAVAELVGLTMWGFAGRLWEEKRSFASDKKPGDKILSEKVTMCDDPCNSDVFRMPFDFHGKCREKFTVVERGVFKNLFYDSSTAAKYGKQPTGHDIGNDDFVFEPGDGPNGIHAACNAAGNALFIPHLHYMHVIDLAKGLFTCSSRFNAMKIENGSFVAPMFSSRVTDTVLTVFNNVVAISPKSVSINVSNTYSRRMPVAVSVPEYIICDGISITDAAESF